MYTCALSAPRHPETREEVSALHRWPGLRRPRAARPRPIPGLCLGPQEPTCTAMGGLAAQPRARWRRWGGEALDNTPFLYVHPCSPELQPTAGWSSVGVTPVPGGAWLQSPGPQWGSAVLTPLLAEPGAPTATQPRTAASVGMHLSSPICACGSPVPGPQVPEASPPGAAPCPPGQTLGLRASTRRAACLPPGAWPPPPAVPWACPLLEDLTHMVPKPGRGGPGVERRSRPLPQLGPVPLVT